MGLTMTIVGAVARRWLRLKWLVLVMIVGGAVVGIAYNILFGDDMFLFPLGRALKTPYCAIIGALAGYMGYRMLAVQRGTAPEIEPALPVDTVANLWIRFLCLGPPVKRV